MSFNVSKDIKEVYKRLTGDSLIGEWDNAKLGERQGHIRDDWYRDYKDWKNITKEYIKILKSGYELDKKDDIKFLKRLFTGTGVAGTRQGRIPPERFENFVNDADVLTAFKNLIVDVNEKSIEDLCNSMRLCNKRNKPRNHVGYYRVNNWLIINRIVATATEDVSSTVDIKTFDKVFTFLQDKGLIETYKGTFVGAENANREALNWYRKNLYLMNELRKKFKTELKTKKTDMTKLSMFFWEFNEYDIKDLKGRGKRKVPRNTKSKKSYKKVKKGASPQPTTPPPLTAFKKIMIRTFKDRAFTYALQFGHTDVWKIGKATNLETRIDDINKHVPYYEIDCCPKWEKREFLKEWTGEKKLKDNEQKAQDMEQLVLKILKDKRTDGERVKCTKEELEQAWNEAKEKIQNQE